MATTRRTRHSRWTVTVSVLAVLATALTATGASARERGELRGESQKGRAQYEGRTIDLQESWEDATTCLVYEGGQTTECFRTPAEADAAQQKVDRSTDDSTTQTSTADARDSSTSGYHVTASSSSSCDSWMTLSDGAYDSGRTLRFRDRGYVQDLAYWGFAYAASSYTIGGCSASFWDGGWSLYPGDTTRWTDANWMASGWNNRVRWIYIH